MLDQNMNIRIEPSTAKILLVDVTCSCGANGLKNVGTGARNFKHVVQLGGNDVTLICDCGKRYMIHPQTDHFHVSEMAS